MAEPICFVPPPENLTPIHRKAAEDTLQICEKAAREEAVEVANFGTPGCAPASLSWSASATGEFEVTCTPGAWGPTCTGAGVRHKRAKVVISDQPGGPPLIETVAVLRSKSSSFKDTTFLALCRVAFHQYPQPLENYKYDVEIEKASR